MSDTNSFIEVIVSDPVAMLACVIALLALFATIWQGYEQRRHNRLSVKPLLSSITRAGKGSNISISLKNMGLGAALIRDVSFWVDGREYKIEAVSDYAKVFYSIGLKDLCGEFLCCSISKGAVFAPNETITLIELPNNCYQESKHTDIVNALAKVKVKATYESLYEETFTTSSGQP